MSVWLVWFTRFISLCFLHDLVFDWLILLRLVRYLIQYSILKKVEALPKRNKFTDQSDCSSFLAYGSFIYQIDSFINYDNVYTSSCVIGALLVRKNVPDNAFCPVNARLLSPITHFAPIMHFSDNIIPKDIILVNLRSYRNFILQFKPRRF